MHRVSAFLGLLSISAIADTSTDAVARFVAGLGSRDASSVYPPSTSSEWRMHAQFLDKAWAELRPRQLDPIRAWVPTHLPETRSKGLPLFYMFSGPDFLYANTFFPECPTYVLCGTEPCGRIPDLAAMSDAEIDVGLQTVRSSLSAVLSYSFFITKDMKADLAKSRFSGTIPLLYVFLVRSGCRIDQAELVHLTENGSFVDQVTITPGVHITFTGPQGKSQQLYYFTTDLSNWGIRGNPGFMKFCHSLGKGIGFTKAASYLMHLKEFTTVRDFLLNHTRMIVQDDSGIPLRDFPASRWLVLGHGSYSKPIDLFADKYQPEMTTLFSGPGAESLPFSFGYRWRKNESALLCGILLDDIPKAKPADDKGERISQTRRVEPETSRR